MSNYGIGLAEVKGTFIDPKSGKTSMVDIPEDGYSRFMYYLYCVEKCTTVEFGRYSQFLDYKNLSQKDKDQIAHLLDVFSSLKMQKHRIFQANDSDSSNDFFVGGSSSGCNSFIELSNPKFSKISKDEITLGDYTFRIKKVMVYDEEWFDSIYTEPSLTVLGKMPEMDLDSSDEAARLEATDVLNNNKDKVNYLTNGVFDADGNLVAYNKVNFDENGNVVSIKDDKPITEEVKFVTKIETETEEVVPAGKGDEEMFVTNKEVDAAKEDKKQQKEADESKGGCCLLI